MKDEFQLIIAEFNNLGSLDDMKLQKLSNMRQEPGDAIKKEHIAESRLPLISP